MIIFFCNYYIIKILVYFGGLFILGDVLCTLPPPKKKKSALKWLQFGCCQK